MGRTKYRKKTVIIYLEDDKKEFDNLLAKRDTTAIILDAIERGHLNKEAVKLANLSEAEFYLWLQEKVALDKPNPYYKVEFSEAVARAKAKRIDFHLVQINQASKKDWKASAWILERIDPRRFGRNYNFAFCSDVTKIPEYSPEELAEIKNKVNVLLANPDCLKDLSNYGKEIEGENHTSNT